MNISEKNMFKIGYTPMISSNTKTKKSWTSFLKLITKNKTIIISIAVFFGALLCNLILLYKFFCILEKIN